MKTIGVFTVGGSPAPIVNAIKETNFDFIYFICSSGKSEVASERIVDGEKLKDNEIIIVRECNLTSEQYEKILLPVDIIDDLNETFKEIEKQLISRINERFPEEETIKVIANYTGGTKTMSVALVLVSIFQEGWELCFNAGQRTNLTKIDSGDFPVAINKMNLLYRIDKTYFDSLMKGYYYEEIIEKTKTYLKYPLNHETRNEIMLIRNILYAFVLWDKFQHEGAYEEFERILKAITKDSPVQKSVVKYYLWLKQILGKKEPFHGYERVIDLMMNAERRAEQERYDDAVARYYRAIEMIAQLRLKLSYGIDNSKINCDELKIDLQNSKFNVQTEKAIEFLREECKKNSEDGILKLALTKSYELLGSMDDPVGKLYLERKNKLLDCLKSRNNSILAHGLTPILKEEFREIKDQFHNFLTDALKAAGVKDFAQALQFPQALKDIGF